MFNYLLSLFSLKKKPSPSLYSDFSLDACPRSSEGGLSTTINNDRCIQLYFKNMQPNFITEYTAKY